MRKALELQLPLIWFVQQDAGRYVPYRVFIINDFPEEGYCLIAPDLSLATASRSESLIERRYAERMMKQRLHQPAFRARVISAYETKCAICRLGHGRLLDAAHITPDSDEASSTSVTNGLSLCKIHHAAYDINIVGIDANYIVHIRPDILSETDGPMLEHGIKEMDKTKLWVPTDTNCRPNPERLNSRFDEFLKSG
jgi:putative restriction endonuclease